MANRRETEFTKKVNEHLIEVAEKGAAVGDKQFVRFPLAMQKEYDIAPFGTVSYELNKRTLEIEEIYVAGPPEYKTKEKPMNYGIPDLNSWLDDYKAGREPPNLANFVPDKIDAHLDRPQSLPSLTTQSYFESWFFSKCKSIIMIDPSTGSVYRACEESCHVRIFLTSSERLWKTQLQKTFCKEIRDEKVSFALDLETEGYVYHGSNGFKENYVTPRSFCLEPNPYSLDMRYGQIVIKSEPDHIYMNYERKDQIREYCFVHRPKFYRVDHLTLYLSTSVKGDSFFFSSIFNPSECLIGIDQSPPTVLSIGAHLLSYPRGKWEKFGEYECQVDDNVIYDIRTPGTYMSRYHKMEEVCPPGYTVVPMYDGYGTIFIHPYAYSPRVTSFARFEDSWIMEDYCAYNLPCPEGVVESLPGIVFRINDFEGTFQAPLDQLGTYYRCPTFTVPGNPRRYFKPDGSRSYYFSSRKALAEWMCFIAHNEIGGVVPLIEIQHKEKKQPVPEYTPPETADLGLNWTSHLISLTTEGVSLTALLAQFPDQPKKLVMKHLLHTSSVLLSEGRFQEDQHEYEDIDDDSPGLMGIVCQSELKRELISAISFEDDIDANVQERINDAFEWKFVLCSVETSEDKVVRTFRRDPIWYD